MNSNDFLQIVLGYIQSKEAKQSVRLELTQHLQKAKAAWLAKGYSELEAEAKAVAELGNPMTLGKSLKRLYKPKIDWLLWTLFAAVLLLGFLPLLTLEESQFTPQMIESLFHEKVVQAMLSIVLAIIIMFIDFRQWARFGYLFYGLGVGFLIFLFLFTNQAINGEIYFELFGMMFHAWYALPFLCIGWAALLSKPSLPLSLMLILALIPMYWITIMPNLPVLFIYCTMLLILFLSSSYSRKQKSIVLSGLLLVILASLLWIFISYRNGSIAPYQLARISAFFNPEAYATSEGYVNVLLNQLIEQAQWFGGSSTVVVVGSFSHLVLAQLIQSYGLVPTLGIVGLLLSIAWRLFHISQNIRLPFGRLVVIGALVIFATQLLYVTAMTFGLVPLTSLTLPFISYGFVSTVFNALWIGIALSMYRYGRIISLH